MTGMPRSAEALPPRFAELVDIAALSGLCESFTALTGAGTAILELDGEILVATGWQDICTRFHRANPCTAAQCRESDTALAGELRQGESYAIYECRNGLVDVAVPIKVGGVHVANLFTGQFFFEPPDTGRFSRQARQYGFDEREYLQALERAPVFSRDHVRTIMGFLTRLAEMLGEMGLAALRLRKANAELESAVARTASDMAERKRLQAGLEAEHRRLENILWGTGFGTWEWNIVTGEARFNEQWAAICGYTLAELAPVSIETWLALAHPEDAARSAAEIERHFRGETDLYECEARMRHKDGHWVWVLDRGRVVARNADGSPRLMAGTHLDITARRRMEDELRASRSALVEAQRLTRTGNWTLEVESGHLRGSEELHRVLDLDPSPAESLFDAILERVHAEDRERVAQSHAALRGRGTPFRLEYRIACRDGSERTVGEHGFAVRGPDGRLVRLSGIAQDVTDRKRIEEARLNSQRLEALGTLAGGIAHDFNNLLSAIRGNAELAAGELRAGHPALECIEEIGKAGARAGELVRRITAFGRPKEHRRDVIGLAGAVKEVLKLLRPTLPAGISLRTGFDERAPCVLADAAQVHEAIVNLTTNAAHAIGGRSGEIAYRLEGIDVGPQEAAGLEIAEGRYARLSVIDTGRGMDLVTMRRIFDAFFTTKPLGEGSGLGLSMVYGIMRSHDGAVAVESAPGAGATFRLYFPEAVAVAESPGEARTVQGVPAPLPPRAPLRVLYVDDEESLVSLANRGLSRLGHKVAGFMDPARAIDALREAPHGFDVVVTDLAMPGMTGIAFARALRAIRPDMPVVLTTGHLPADLEAEAREAGLDEIIAKPATAHELSAAIARAAARVSAGGRE